MPQNFAKSKGCFFIYKIIYPLRDPHGIKWRILKRAMVYLKNIDRLKLHRINDQHLNAKKVCNKKNGD